MTTETERIRRGKGQKRGRYRFADRNFPGTAGVKRASGGKKSEGRRFSS